MALAALAILGHRSAHSFPIGPVIADPTITSNTILKTRTKKQNKKKKLSIHIHIHPNNTSFYQSK
jgi:UDP-N-acetylmuramyl pentapeptide phosphotransferase/UDP-N-acetylglucosamine-1-phosphate transferase